MKIITSLRRAIATALLTAGLVYPACAAVCPKGIGGCTSPGRCFLFIDADGNALCDYTSRSGSPVPAVSVPSRTAAPEQTQTSVTATVTPVPDPAAVQVTSGSVSSPPVTSVTRLSDANTSGIQNTSSGGFLDSVHLSAPLAEAVIFLLFAGIIFTLIRTGVLGIRIEKALPALALSSLIALGLSLMITSVLTGSGGGGTTYALCYMGAATLLAGYLWYTGVMTRNVIILAAGLSTLTGFVFLAPIMPMELGGIVNVMTGLSALNPGIIVICAVIALTLVVGRIFCGTICPVGSLQELAYTVPGKKIIIRRTAIPEVIRLFVFAATAVAALYLIDLLAFTGLYDLFSLTLSYGMVVAAGIIVLSMVVYRPVCRFICPFGVLFSLFAEFSWFRLRRNGTCINCNKCEKACPARTSGKDDTKRECYLCGRCTRVCPVKTALSYRR